MMGSFPQQQISICSSSLHGEINERLHKSIDTGNVIVMRDLLCSGASINGYFEGLTPVARALANSQKDIALELLKYHPDPYQGRRELLKIQHVCEVFPLLHLAIDFPEVFARLLEMGADVNVEGFMDQNSLHVAVQHRQEELLKLLLCQGCEVNHADREGRTPLHYATSLGEEHLVEILLRNEANVNLFSLRKKTPLLCAAEYGFCEIVNMLTIAGAHINASYKCIYSPYSPLSVACMSGHLDCVKLLIKLGAAVNDVEESDAMPLCVAVRHCQEEIVKCLLIEGKANPNRTNIRCAELYKMPLHEAASFGNVAITSILLQHGADLQAKDCKHGRNALCWALLFGNFDVSCLLIDAGINIEVVSEKGIAGEALHQVALLPPNEKGSAITQKLIAKGINVSGRHPVKNRRRITFLPEETQPQKIVERCPLHTCAMYCQDRMTELLLAAPDIDINAVDADGATPLKQALTSKYDSNACLLIEGSAFISDDSGSSYLSLAISSGCFKAAALLVQCGAAVNCRDERNSLPLELLLGAPSPNFVLRIFFLAGAKCDYAFVSNVFDIEKRDLLISHLNCIPTLCDSSIHKIRQVLSEVAGKNSIFPLIKGLNLPVILQDYLRLSLG